MEANLAFDEAVQLTTQLETADKELPELHGVRSHSTVTTTASVQYTHGKQPPKGAQRTYKTFWRGPSSNNKTSGACHRCGNKNHWTPQCSHKADTYKQCGKIGRWAKLCDNMLSNVSNKGTD